MFFFKSPIYFIKIGGLESLQNMFCIYPKWIKQLMFTWMNLFLLQVIILFGNSNITDVLLVYSVIDINLGHIVTQVTVSLGTICLFKWGHLTVGAAVLIASRVLTDVSCDYNVYTIVNSLYDGIKNWIFIFRYS